MAQSDRSTQLVGRIFAQCEVVGSLGVIGAIVAFTQGEWRAGGLCLVAAALAVGLAANAVLRE